MRADIIGRHECSRCLQEPAAAISSETCPLERPADCNLRQKCIKKKIVVSLCVQDVDIHCQTV